MVPGEDERGGLRDTFHERRGTELQFSDRALEHGDLGGGIAGGFQFVAHLIFEVGGIPDTVEEEIQESLGRQQALFLELLDGVVAHRHVCAADVEDHIVVTASGDPLKP